MKLAYPVTSPEGRGKVKAFTKDYERAFPLLQEWGYQGVELLVRDPDQVDRQYLGRCLRQWNLKLAAVGTSPMQIMDKLFLVHPEESVRREARRRCSGLLRLCRDFGAPALMGKYRGQISGEPGCGREDLAECMEGICREAKDLGVQVLLEPQNASNINNLNTIDETLSWIEERERAGCGNLGILADIYHMGITEKSIPESIRRAGGRIGFIHMADSDRKIPGEGRLPVGEVMKTLQREQYERYVSLEIDQTPSSEAAAERSARALLAYVVGGENVDGNGL